MTWFQEKIRATRVVPGLPGFERDSAAFMAWFIERYRKTLRDLSEM